jgi:hypothetical protein
MLNIGLSNKVKIQIDPAEGYPKVIATSRIIQGEPIETACAHDITVDNGVSIFSISNIFTNALKPNPVKMQRMDSDMTEYFNTLKSELLDSDKLITQEEIDNIAKSEKFIKKLNSYHWMDFLSGYVSIYTVSDYPNANVEWNDTLKLWQVVALTEILPDAIISLPKPKE